MPTKLKKDQRLDEAIKNAAIDQVNKAVDALQNNEDKAKAIHYARKRMKEVRAILRLVRDKLKKSIYQKENIFFRDIARKMADLRDYEVFIETLKELKEYTSNTHLKGAVNKVVQHAQPEYENQTNILLNQENILQTVSDKLTEAKEHINNWPIKGNKFSLIRSGLYRVYDRGYKAYKTAYKAPSIENFHEFRKRVKYLWYQIEFLENAWNSVLKPLRKEISKLSDITGKDHDYGMLMIQLEKSDFNITDNQKKQIIDLAQAQRVQLQKEAKPLGRKIYVDKPKTFIKRMEQYWKIWRGQ